MARLLAVLIVSFCSVAFVSLAQESAPAPLEVPPESMQGLLLRKVAPLYPPLARQARIRGTVILSIVIDKSGNVSRVELYSGHPMLAPAAIEAVKQWKYKPYEKDGEAVEVKTTVQVNFKMPDSQPPPGIAGDAPGGSLEHQPITSLPACEATTSGTVPKRVRVSTGVMQGLMVSNPAPAYPADAREQHVEGVVLMQIEIGRDGKVCDLALISGHPLLAPAAMDAVRHWTYRPYLLNGDPVEVNSQVMVKFTLTRKNN